MSVRGVPVQDLPENQDPSVRATYDEILKTLTPWETPAEEPKRRGRPPKVRNSDEEVPGEPAADEGTGE